MFTQQGTRHTCVCQPIWTFPEFKAFETTTLSVAVATELCQNEETLIVQDKLFLVVMGIKNMEETSQRRRSCHIWVCIYEGAGRKIQSRSPSSWWLSRGGTWDGSAERGAHPSTGQEQLGTSVAALRQEIRLHPLKGRAPRFLGTGPGPLGSCHHETSWKKGCLFQGS